MDKLAYGLIGTGGMGTGHINTLSLVEDVDIVAIADSFAPNLDKAREALGGDVWSTADYRELLARADIDAVVVATPNCTHADIVVDALNAGKNVLSEKPMATTVADCRRVMQTEEATGLVYQVGLELRYGKQYEKKAQVLQSGELGEVRHVWCKEFRGPWGHKVNDWIVQKRYSGGTLLEKDCHHFDLFNWFVGSRPVRVAGFGTVDLVYGTDRFGVEPDVLDNAQVIVSYENGAVAVLMLNMYCQGIGEGLEIGVVGRDGWVQSSLSRNEIVVRKRLGDDRQTHTFDVPEHIRKQSHHGMVYYEHVAFAESVRTGKRPRVGSEVGFWSTVVALAAERAVEENRVVEIAEML